ncbi:MAG: type II toxin-antitoxin system HicB family antitoxin [Nitrospirae bacterium]|nr:type II toxin-antitoxin system HicB family antitoxin [Nitrospirota bacterium]
MAISGKSTVTVDGKAFKVTIHSDMATSGFSVECSEIGVVSQGKTIRESLKTIQEAIILYLGNHPAGN